MPLNNILPQYQAEERSAQVNVRPVPMPNHMDMAGRLLSQAGGDALKATYGLAMDMKRRKDALQAKEDDLAVTQAVNGFREAYEKFDAEQSHRLGADAVGNTERLDDWWPKNVRQFGANLSLEASRAFNNQIARMHPTCWRSTYNYEWEQTTQANIQARKTETDNALGTYRIYGDSDSLALYLGACRREYEAQFGTAIDENYIAKYDSDKLHGTARSENRDALVARGKQFENYMQGKLDNAIGSHLDSLLKGNDVDGAIRYYSDMESRLSRDAQAKALPVILAAKDNQDWNALGAAWWEQCVAEADEKSLGGTFLSAKQEEAYARRRAPLANSTNPKDKIVLAALDNAHDARVAIQKANFGTAKAEALQGLFRDPANEEQYKADLLQLWTLIGKLGDSYLKDELLEEYTNRANFQAKRESDRAQAVKSALNEARSEENRVISMLKESELRKANLSLLELRLGMSDRQFSTVVCGKNVTYDLNKDADFEAMLFDLNYRNIAGGGWMLDEDANRLRIARRMKSTARHQASSLIQEVLNRNNNETGWTPYLVAAAAPSLVDDVMAEIYLYTGGKDKLDKTSTDAVKDYILTRLGETRDDGTFFSSQWTLEKWLNKGLITGDGFINAAYNQRAFNALDELPKSQVEQMKQNLLRAYGTSGGHDDFDVESEKGQFWLNVRNKVKADEKPQGKR